MYTELIAKTTLLIERCNQSLNRMEDVQREDDYEADFYNEVKPYVDEVMVITDRWMQLANDWIKRENPKHLHPNQIDATHENIQLISIQGFYKDTKSRRFKAMYESVIYILDSIIKKVNE